MSTFVLVHGAFSGGWAWNKVIPLLENEGHTVFAPDMPGHGKNRPGGLAVPRSRGLYIVLGRYHRVGRALTGQDQKTGTEGYAG